MSTFKIKVANFFAKNSCSAWQSSRPIRIISRKIYRFVMEAGAKEYPYADMNFANWPESDEDGSYSLVSDSCGFVIRRSPSYIAWKIKQTTGKWPKLPVPGKRAPGEHSFDAKHWDEVLEFNGWQRLGNPREFSVLDGVPYVGIIADWGEFGQLVWLETLEKECGYDYDDVLNDFFLEDHSVCGWKVSTYEDFRKVNFTISSSRGIDVVWYAGPRPNEEY